MGLNVQNSEKLPLVDGCIPNPSLGFGEKAKDWPPYQTCCQKVRRLVLPILLGVLCLCVGATVGIVVSLPIAIAVSSGAIISIGLHVGFGLGFIGIVALAIVMVKNRYRSIPGTAYLKPSPKEIGAAPVGSFNEKNSVLLTKHAVETSNWKLNLIRNAKQSIEISGSFCGGPLFQEALAIIKKRLVENPNLKVHIISANVLLDAKDLKDLDNLEKLFPNNFKVLKTTDMFALTPAFCNFNNHVKVVCVDEKYFVVGGTNFYHLMGTTKGDKDLEHAHDATLTDRSMAAGYRDMDIVGRGEIAKTLRLEFYKLWALWEHRLSSNPAFEPKNRYFAINRAEKCTSKKWLKAAAKKRIVKNVKMKVLVCDAEKPNAITSEYVRMINSAKKTVLIANYTFNPAKEILVAAQKAVKSKTKVTVITNGVLDVSPPSHAMFIKPNHNNYLPLMVGREVSLKDNREKLSKECDANGRHIKIYEYAKKNIIYHTKVLVADDTVTIGSYNLNKKSRWDEELNIVIENPEVVKKFMENFSKDIKPKLSRPVKFDKAFDNYNSWMAWLQDNVVQYFV